MIKLERNIEKLANKEYDLIIVGGGIYGVMLSLEAARRNLKSLLLEKEDFNKQTSHNHLRTVHGGLRYLQTLDLPRFNDSVTERKWFLKYFPQFVNVMPCMMPLYNKKLLRKSVMWAALLLNDILSFNRNFSVTKERHLPGGKILSFLGVKEKFPLVNKDGLKGGALWHDANLGEFQRLFITLLNLAGNHGAEAINYMNVLSPLSENGSITGVSARDEVSGEKHDFKAPVVINATGPWCRDTAETFDKDFPQLFKKRLLLWNVLFDREALSEYALGLSTEKGGGHTYFFHPWKNRLLVGTGELVVEKSETETTVPPGEMDKFIADINKIVPGLNLTQKDILRVYSGILPADQEGKLAGRPITVDHGKKGGLNGFYSLSGVKFTTSRLVADKAMDFIFPGLAKVNYDKITEHMRATDFEFDYDWEPTSDHDLNILEEFVEREKVVHLSDLILRRTSLGDNPHRALNILPKIRHLFDWNEKIWRQEIKMLKDELGRAVE